MVKLNVKEILKTHLGIKEIENITTLGTREEGQIIREHIEFLVDNNRGNNKNTDFKILVDFQGLDIVSHCFADEIFGELIEKYGWSFVRDYIKPINANNSIKEVLKTVIAFRIWKKQNLP